MKPDYIEFQDRSTPLAYMITIRCYGTWLHGDSRGSMDRAEFNRYGGPKIPTNPGLKKSDISMQISNPMKLDAAKRDLITKSIQDVCKFRGHHLFALNIRTNHVHAVVSAGRKVESIMHSFKAYSTRTLREKGLIGAKTKIWSRHGSTKYLWTDEHIASAVEYVLYGQGDDLPEFD